MKNSRNIGRIVSIGINGIIAEVYNTLGSFVNTIDGVRFVGEVGSYVSIYEKGRTIIAEVVGVDEKSIQNNYNDIKKPKSSRQMILNLVGEIKNKDFKFGVTKMPMIFSEVYLVSEKDLMLMLEVGKEEELVSDDNTRALLLKIGKSVIFPDYDVKINIDKFFGFHFAIFGNTGAGKSNTMARIIQNIFLKENYSAKGAKFIVIDSNGEYNSAFNNINEKNSSIKSKLFVADNHNKENNPLEIPVWALSAEDWAILLHASEKTQIPVLRRAIHIAKIFYNDSSDIKTKNHILASTLLGIILSSDSSPSKSDKLNAILNRFFTEDINLDIDLDNGDIKTAIGITYGKLNGQEELINFLEELIDSSLMNNLNNSKIVPYSITEFSEAVEFARLYEGSVSSQRIQEYTATLTTRLQALIEGVQGKIFLKTEYTNINDYIESILLGENQIVDIDISSLDDSSAEVVTKVLAKLFFDYSKNQPNKADKPINLIIEEAHRFVKNETNYGAVGYNIFERISKEGRKYGFLLGISSQRPSELSKTVVSQCSNFIIHRVQNPDDLNYISRMVPYINKNIISRLTYLQTGNALVFGSAITLPTLTQFDIATPRTDSENAKISEKWYVE